MSELLQISGTKQGHSLSCFLAVLQSFISFRTFSITDSECKIFKQDGSDFLDTQCWGGVHKISERYVPIASIDKVYCRDQSAMTIARGHCLKFSY